MAIKYLAGERMTGTAAERTALTTLGSSGWLNNAGLQGTGGSGGGSGSGFDSSEFNDVNVDTSAGNIKAKNWATSTSHYSGNAISYQLPSAMSDTAWTLRFSVTTSYITSGPHGNAYWNIGFADALWLAGEYDDTSEFDSTVGTGDNDDAIFFAWHIADSNIGYSVMNNDARQDDLSALVGSHSLSTSDTRYYQITRNNSTTLGMEYHGTSGFGSVSATTTETPSSLANISDLNNLTTGFPYNNRQGEWELRIDNIQVWNGTSYHGATPNVDPTYSFDFSNSYPNFSNGTIFEESDTGKHYMFNGTDTWNEM